MAIILRCTNDNGVVADLQPLGNETIRLDISAIESGQIGDVFGVSSQNFTLPGTPENQAFFGYLDNLGSTPAVGLSKTVPCQVLNDGMEVFTGKLYITDIITNQKGDTIYNVVVVNETVDFKLEIQDLYLAGLDWSSYDHTLTYANITSSWTGSGLFKEDIVYPLVDYGADSSNPFSTNIVAGGKDRNFDNSEFALQVTDFKPAIRLKAVVDRIFDSVGYKYTSSFFDSADFQNIYMLSTQDDKNGLTFVNPVSQSFQINKSGDSEQVLPNVTPTKVIFGNEVFDNANNVATSRFTANVDGVYTFYTSVDYRISGSTDSRPDLLEIALYANGTSVLNADTFVNVKGTSLGVAYLGPISLNLTAGDYVEVYVNREYELGSRVMSIRGTVNSKFEGIGPNTVQGGTVNVGRVFDPQAKVIDFLQGIIQKFNLVIEPVKGERNVLRIETFNDWVDLGQVRNWTDKVDRSTKFSIKHPLQDQSKTIIFSDIEDNDILNNYTKTKFDKIYGSYTYTSDSDLSLGERKVGTFFAPTPMKYIDGAANMVVPQLYQRENGNERASYKFKPRLLYKIGLQDCPPQLRGYNPSGGTNSFGTYFIEDESGTVHAQSQWMLFHHLNAFPAVFDTTKDLHFGNLNQWSYHQKQFNARTKNSAFFDYWAFYINELYDVDSRLLTCNVIIEPHELPQIQLNDKIFIDGHYYRINKISGANLMREDSIKVELLKTAPRKIKFPRRRIFELANPEPFDVTIDFDNLSPGGTGVYVGYDDFVPVTSSVIVSTAASADGYAAFGDQVVWDNVKPVQFVATAQELQGNSTLDPSANFVKVTGDANIVKSSTQKVNINGDGNTISEYNEFVTIDGSNNTIGKEVTNTTLLQSNNSAVGENSTNVTLLNTVQTQVTASDQVVVVSDVLSKINNGSNNGTTTFIGTRGTTISGSINDVTVIGTKDIAISGGNYHVVIGKDNETTSNNLDLSRYRINTNVLNDTYLDDGLYLNRDGLALVLGSGSIEYAYSGDGLFKYIYDIEWDTEGPDGIATIELPGIASQEQEGRSILFKCSQNISSSRQIYIESVGATDTIDGGNRYVLNEPYAFVELRAGEENGRVEWRVIRSSAFIGTTIISGSDNYVTNVSFSNPNLSVTSLGAGFSGLVNLSTLVPNTASYALTAATASYISGSVSNAVSASYANLAGRAIFSPSDTIFNQPVAIHNVTDADAYSIVNIPITASGFHVVNVSMSTLPPNYVKIHPIYYMDNFSGSAYTDTQIQIRNTTDSLINVGISALYTGSGGWYGPGSSAQPNFSMNAKSRVIDNAAGGHIVTDYEGTAYVGTSNEETSYTIYQTGSSGVVYVNGSTGISTIADIVDASWGGTYLTSSTLTPSGSDGIVGYNGNPWYYLTGSNWTWDTSSLPNSFQLNGDLIEYPYNGIGPYTGSLFNTAPGSWFTMFQTGDEGTIFEQGGQLNNNFTSSLHCYVSGSDLWLDATSSLGDSLHLLVTSSFALNTWCGVGLAWTGNTSSAYPWNVKVWYNGQPAVSGSFTTTPNNSYGWTYQRIGGRGGTATNQPTNLQIGQFFYDIDTIFFTDSENEQQFKFINNIYNYGL